VTAPTDGGRDDPAGPEDLGEADPRLVTALESGDVAAVRATLLEVRVLVPVVAIAGAAAGRGPGPDAGAEMAVPRLVNAEGRHALPVFSSYDTLRAWRPDGRPVPMPGAQAVAAAISEGYDAVVLDVAGPISCSMEVIRDLGGGLH
jgi:hypothetical protein